MTPWSFAVAVAALCLITGQLAASQEEPLCQNKVCGRTSVCRVMEKCTSPNSCTTSTTCLQNQDSLYYSGGCRVGEPLLTRQRGGQYDLRTCYTDRNCPEGFYCSTALQDVASRCCRAAPVSATKPGSCPAPEQRETFFCVDQCLSDADCFYDMKCCQTTQSCSHKSCTSPDPCSLKRCPRGSRCVVDPDFNAHCEGRYTGPGTMTPPPRPLASNLAQDNQGSGRPSPTCPHLLTPVNWARDCRLGNRCLPTSARPCLRGKSCCPSFYCGFICR